MALPHHDNGTNSLNDRFQELDAERRRTWTAEALAIYDGQRSLLTRTLEAHASVRAGDVLPAATLTRTDGTKISLDSLVAQGPAVLVFFRYANCPACNIALPYYRDTLWPALSAANIPLVAISPQPIEPLHEIVTRHQLPFTVASDGNLSLSRAIGITFVFDEPSRKAAEARGGTSAALNGTSTWELPKPAIIVVAPGRVVRFADVSPDWIVRTETPAVLEALGLAPQEATRAA